MNYQHICTAGMVAHHDMLTAHEALEAGPTSIHMRLVLMRHLTMEIANVAKAHWSQALREPLALLSPGGWRRKVRSSSSTILPARSRSTGG